MKIFILIFLFGLSSDFLLSQELFRGENLLVKPPKISEYKGFHKESGGLKVPLGSVMKIARKILSL